MRRLAPLAAAAALLALTACSDGTTAPSASQSARTTPNSATTTAAGDRLATIEWEGSRPALYLQNSDGSGRVRIHFENVRDDVPGNYPPEVLPVNDGTIIAMGPAHWSPDGRQLAVVVAAAFDQSEVIVMNADGSDQHVASINSQAIVGDVEWAPDASRIVYLMGTSFQGSKPDLFVTELATSQVVRITRTGDFSAIDRYRFAPNGMRIYFTRFAGWTADGVSRISNVYSMGLGNQGNREPIGQIVGDPQGLSRDGTWALTIRWTDASYTTRALIRQPIAGKGEVRLAAGDLLYATLLDGDAETFVASNGKGGSLWSVMSASTPNAPAEPVAVPAEAASAALFRAAR